MLQNQIMPACGSLGGVYVNSYDYDRQYRLTEAICNIGTFQYNFFADYSPAGRLGHSFCSNTGVADGNALYGYDNYYLTHQPRVVFDYNKGILMELFWDADGNLFQVQDCKTPMARFHDWDEENRLRLMLGNSTAGYYGYDAKGERVYKLTSDKGGMEFDGDEVQAYFIWSDATLYPNPYLTITPTGYTKHYYANSERLSTVLGEGGWFLMSKDAISDLTQDEEHDMGHAFDRYSEHFPLGLPSAVLTKNKDIDEQVVQELQYDCPQKTLVSIDLDCTMNPNALYSRMYRNLAVNGTETNVYYTHNDHLGSASWITDRYAHPTQYLHYLPYEQLLANQKATTYNERYKFIGKERDWESGYDYFGARYYISPFLHFASVEPLLDKYLHISPYSYAAWNPIKFMDQDGRIVRFAKGTTFSQKQQFWTAVRYLDKHYCGGRYGQLKSSRTTYYVNMNTEKSQFKPNEQTIYWLPDKGLEIEENGKVLSPATVLNHEMTHATHYDDAVKQYYEGNEQAFKEYENRLKDGTSQNYNSLEEESVITGIEQRTAKALGEIGEGEITRTNHGGKLVLVEGPTSNQKIDELK